MFIFADHRSLYARLGLVLLLLQFGLFIFSLPPFQTGLWAQNEPIMLGFFVCALLNSLWLAIGIAQRRLASVPNHLLWKCMVAWVGWQVVATAFAATPWRSWFGNSQTGEGLGWYVILLLMVMLATPLWQIQIYRRALFFTATLDLLVLSALQWFNPAVDLFFDSQRWTPVQYPAYLAFIAGYLWIVATAVGLSKRTWWYCLIAALIGVVLFISKNKSAITLFPGAMIVGILLSTLPLPRTLRRFFYPGKWWRGLAIAACLLPLGWVAFSEGFPALKASYGDTNIISFLSDSEGSLGSRVIINQIAMSAMRHEPSRWIIGDGWGNFFEDMFKYILVDGIRIWQDGHRNPSSTMVDGGGYHSHNQPLEALLSLGLPGLVLWFAVPVAALLGLSRRYFWRVAPMLVAMVVLDYFWFQVFVCLPYQAISLAVLCHLQSRGNHTPTVKQPLWIAAALSVVSVVMVWSCSEQVRTILYSNRLEQRMNDVVRPGDNGEWMAEDIKRGGDRFRAVIPFYLSNLAEKSKRSLTSDNDVVIYGMFLQTAHAMAKAPQVGPAETASEPLIWAFAHTALKNDPLFADFAQKAGDRLEEPVITMVQRAPLRDDLETFYLKDLAAYTHQDIPRQTDILMRILTIAPNHRGALWVLGKILIGQESTKADGIAMMKKAVSLGLDKVFPVTDEEMKQYQ